MNKYPFEYSFDPAQVGSDMNGLHVQVNDRVAEYAGYVRETNDTLLIEAVRRATGKPDAHPRDYAGWFGRVTWPNGDVVKMNGIPIIFIGKPVIVPCDEDGKFTIDVPFEFL
jgi:hypothetical protein